MVAVAGDRVHPAELVDVRVDDRDRGLEGGQGAGGGFPGFGVPGRMALPASSVASSISTRSAAATDPRR
ncbi:hypothetical protein GCM10025870_15760 [Agromyces marinus]|uniref:Uncharacterized protein n=1 Tax=Agromyces marinus TaxID=1389020 RepID=A0ABM8H175_9MICO|nr:hypothetical protein GCM10025870_15760 [Agromyces marinus]